jgi:hypothetical protein
MAKLCSVAFVGSLAIAVTGASATSVTIGCGSGCSGSSTIIASCTNTSGGFCVDYTGSEYTAAKVQATCTSQGMTYSASPCATASRGGSCLVYCGKSSEAIYRYYASFPGGSGTSQCTNLLKGAWTPG